MSRNNAALAVAGGGSGGVTGALDMSPGRFRRIVHFAHELGVAGLCEADAVDAIEDAIWADGALPADTPSQRRAWQVVRARALEAFSGSEDAIEAARNRAHHAAPAILGRMPHDTGLNDFVATLKAAEPPLARDVVERIARGVVEQFARPPVTKLTPHPSDIFATISTQPDARRMALHERAKALATSAGISIAEPADVEDDAQRSRRDAARQVAIDNARREWAFADLAASALAWLEIDRQERVVMWEAHPTKLATVDGEPETASPQSEWKPLDLRDPVNWRNPPAKLFGMLRSIDFDPAITTSPPSWLVKGVAPRRGLGLLYGASGSGKTFLAIHAALSVSWGLPFFGNRTKPGAVLYIAAEGGASVVPRIRAANEALAGAIAAANLTRAPGDGPLSRAPLRIVTEAPNLSRDGDSGPLLRTIRQAEADFATAGHRLAMVVVDTWHAAMGGGEENSAADVGAALAPIREAAEAGSFFALLVHHPGKDLDRGARGSNALPAAVDASIELRVPGHDGAHVPSSAMRCATVVKMRDGETGAAFNYRLPVVPIGVDEDGDTWTTCVVQPCDAPKLDDNGLSSGDRDFMTAVRATIAEGAGGRARVEEVRLRFYTGRPGAKPDAVRKAWGRAVQAARSGGRIITDDQDQYIWLPTQPSEA